MRGGSAYIAKGAPGRAGGAGAGEEALRAEGARVLPVLRVVLEGVVRRLRPAADSHFVAGYYWSAANGILTNFARKQHVGFEAAASRVLPQRV